MPNPTDTNQARDIGNKGGVERGAIIMDSTKIPKVRNPKPTDFKSRCCNALVVEYDPTGKGAEKHWLGHQCTGCGNQAPLSSTDLLKIMGVKKKG